MKPHKLDTLTDEDLDRAAGVGRLQTHKTDEQGAAGWPTRAERRKQQAKAQLYRKKHKKLLKRVRAAERKRKKQRERKEQ